MAPYRFQRHKTRRSRSGLDHSQFRLSFLLLKADISRRDRHVRSVPIVLQKSQKALRLIFRQGRNKRQSQINAASNPFPESPVRLAHGGAAGYRYPCANRGRSRIRSTTCPIAGTGGCSALRSDCWPVQVSRKAREKLSKMGFMMYSKKVRSPVLM